jgi:competence protein ComEC
MGRGSFITLPERVQDWLAVPWVAQLRDEAAAQSAQAFLWLVVAFGVGVGIFFAWPTDPPMWLGPSVSGIPVLGVILRRRFDGATLWLLGLVMIGLGLTAAQVRVSAVVAPVLVREIGPIDVTGRVYDVAREPGRVRVILERVRFEAEAGTRKPVRIRLSVPGKHGAPRVGDTITVRAVLRPPERPVLPGAFEYQRFLFFDQIGGLGYTVSPWRLAGGRDDDAVVSRVRTSLENLRRSIADRILAVVPGDAGAVAVALVTGEQSLITEDTQEVYRVSGLAHLLSISGLHMTLLAGAVFFIVRRSLALWPFIALRFDLKKVAAWAALGATFFYVLISGMSVPAVRAFIMVAVAIIAILFDRRAVSLRSVGFAALALLALYPEALVGASFQMSFMAVLALIALYEHVSLRPIWRGEHGEFLLGRAVGVYIAALVVTDVVAGSVTSIFAAYHFNRMPSYSVVANLFATPITGVWIMPMGLVALALMPLGLDAWAWRLMGQGVATINDIAAWVAQWPGAQVHVPPMATWALAGAAVGLVVICLWKGRLRWIGLVPVIFAVAQPWLAAVPDVLIDESGRVVAVSDANGRMMLEPSRRDRFVRGVVKDRFAESRDAWPNTENSYESHGLRCDGQGCVLRRHNTTLSLATTPDALAEDCGRVDIVLAPLQFVDRCPGSRVIDRGDLFRNGAHAVYLDDGQARIITVEDVAGHRMWSRAPEPRRRAPTTETIRTEDAAD